MDENQKRPTPSRITGYVNFYRSRTGPSPSLGGLVGSVRPRPPRPDSKGWKPYEAGSSRAITGRILAAGPIGRGYCLQFVPGRRSQSHAAIRYGQNGDELTISANDGARKGSDGNTAIQAREASVSRNLGEEVPRYAKVADVLHGAGVELILSRYDMLERVCGRESVSERFRRVRIESVCSTDLRLCVPS